MDKKLKEILDNYSGKEHYGFEEAKKELLDLFGVSGSLPDEDWIKKNAPLNPDATHEDVLIHNWWIGGVKDYREELLKRLEQ